MESIDLELKTLTPIWTGDANGKCTDIKEASIIGSMRWWYEAMVRGMGGYACNPLNDGCEFNIKGYENAFNEGKIIEDALVIGLKEVCPACRLFGCTGWRRRFRVEIEKVDSVKLNFVNKLDDINSGWWIGETLKANPKALYSSDILKLKLISEDNEIENKILVLLKLIESMGAFGAKSQNGFGIVEFFLKSQLKRLRLDKEIALYNENHPEKSNSNESRNLKNFYTFVIKIKSIENVLQHFGDKQKIQDYILIGFTLKYYLRKRFKEFDDEKISELVINRDAIEPQIEDKHPAEKYNKISKIVARTLFGSDLGDENSKWASLIEVSHIYKKGEEYQFRIVCFLPTIVKYDGIDIKFNISSVIDAIQNLLVSVLGDSIKIEETWSGMEVFKNLFEN